MTRTTTIWTFVITSVALFMATLDNLVVTWHRAGAHREGLPSEASDLRDTDRLLRPHV